MSEQIVLLRRLWTEAVVDFSGAFHRLDRLALNPRPTTSIPIYCGGVSEPAFRRAAKLADGFIFGGDLARVTSAWQSVRRFLEEEGRDPTGFGADYQFPDGTDVRSQVDLVRRWEDAGGTQCAVRTMKLGYKTAQQHIDHLADLRALLG
jgi:hypothetical protein